MILERGEGWEASGHQERGGLLRPDHHLAGLTDVWCRVSPTHGVFLVNCSQLSEDLNEQGDSIDLEQKYYCKSDSCRYYIFKNTHLTIFGGIRVVACRVAPVEVNIVPASLLPLPHPRLLCLGGEGVTLSEHKHHNNPDVDKQRLTCPGSE